MRLPAFTIACYVVAVFVVAGCKPAPERPHTLAVMDGRHSRCDNLILVTMPDVGDYEFNGGFVHRDSVPTLLHAAYDSRHGPCRVLFLSVNPRRAWEDVEFLEREAAKIQVPLYDARLSHVIRTGPKMTCRTDVSERGVWRMCASDWNAVDSEARHAHQ